MPIIPKFDDIELNASIDEFKHFKHVDADVAHMGFDIKGELIHEEKLNKNPALYQSFQETVHSKNILKNLIEKNNCHSNIFRNYPNINLALNAPYNVTNSNFLNSNIHGVSNICNDNPNYRTLNNNNDYSYNQKSYKESAHNSRLYSDQIFLESNHKDHNFSNNNENSISLFPFVHSSKIDGLKNLVKNNDTQKSNILSYMNNQMINQNFSFPMNTMEYSNKFYNDYNNLSEKHKSNTASVSLHTPTKGAIKKRLKKPLNAFMLYMKEMRPKIVSETTIKESAAINRIIGKMWHELDKKEQSKYYELARQERLKHRQLHLNAEQNGFVIPNVLATKRKIRRGKINGLLATKKCRARYGLEHQELWCRPCRRKKKCERYFKSHDIEDSNSAHIPSSQLKKKRLTTRDKIESSDSENNISNDSLIQDQEKNESTWIYS